MTSDELKKAVSTVLEQPHHTQLYLVLKINNELVLRLADVEDEKTAPEIQRLFEEFLTAAIVDNDDMIVRNLSIADESSNAIYQYDYNSYPEELGLFKSFRLKTAIKTKKFNFHTDDLGSLFGYIIYLGSMEKGIVLFKKHYPISLIKRGISKEAIVEFTKNTPELAGKFKYSEDGTQIRLGTKKSKIAFLKLMNDAFLHSELTKQWYDASAKDNITQGAG